MSIEFRQRTTGEFIQMLDRRKWMIILPAIVFFLATAWVVRGLPNMYESKSALIIMPPAISEKVAPSLTDVDLGQRVLAMRQTVLSRASVQELIERFGLYAEEREAGTPIERVVAKVQGSVTVIPEKADDRKVVGFTVSFRYPSPEKAQDVTAAIAEKYVESQTVASTQSAETTREFIDDQLAQAKSSLDSLEKERLNVMLRNVDALPESGQGLIAQLQGLRQREQTISKDKETLITERGRVNESIRAINSQMRLIEDFGEKETREAINQAARIEDTPAYGQLVQRRAELSGRLESLSKQYREKHPDIVQTRTDIEKVNDEIDKLARSTEQRVKFASHESRRKAELQKKSLEIERQKAEGQIAQIDHQLQLRDAEGQKNAAQIAVLESRINTIPNVKVALEGVENQYQSAKSNYDELLKKFNNAQQQVQRESNAQGETIQVIDPASLPQAPINSGKQPFLVLAGTGFGLLLGLFFGAIFEVPRMLKIQGIDDAQYYTGLPVLATVPSLLTGDEIENRSRSYWRNLIAGTAASVIAVPVLVSVFEATQILERFS